MVLDIELFREEKGGDLEVIRKSQRNRYKNVEIVDQVIDLDKQWRTKKHEMELLKRKKNLMSKTIGTKIKVTI